MPSLTVCALDVQVAGTEQGITEPEATFSACFGGAFLLWHPMKYASMLAEKMDEHGTNAWLVNTGWTGGRLVAPCMQCLPNLYHVACAGIIIQCGVSKQCFLLRSQERLKYILCSSSVMTHLLTNDDLLLRFHSTS